MGARGSRPSFPGSFEKLRGPSQGLFQGHYAMTCKGDLQRPLFRARSPPHDPCKGPSRILQGSSHGPRQVSHKAPKGRLQRPQKDAPKAFMADKGRVALRDHPLDGAWRRFLDRRSQEDGSEKTAHGDKHSKGSSKRASQRPNGPLKGPWPQSLFDGPFRRCLLHGGHRRSRDGGPGARLVATVPLSGPPSFLWKRATRARVGPASGRSLETVSCQGPSKWSLEAAPGDGSPGHSTKTLSTAPWSMVADADRATAGGGLFSTVTRLSRGALSTAPLRSLCKVPLQGPL